MNGLTLLALIALAVGIVVAYRAGALAARREMRARTAVEASPASVPPPVAPPSELTSPKDPPIVDAIEQSTTFERARLVRSYAGEIDRVQRLLVAGDTERARITDDHAQRTSDLDEARREAARYRQLVIDIENNAPPPLLDSPTAPDDLKMIVGIGPVLERMLQQLGVSSYRQIARWSERDIDDFDARLPEFPGRIRRDEWVTQARALHQSKYGESAVSRERS